MIDDDEDVLLAAKMLLKKQNHHVIIEKNPKKIPFLLNNDTYDVILLDMNFSKDITSGKEGFYWLEQILERDPQAVVILIMIDGETQARNMTNWMKTESHESEISRRSVLSILAGLYVTVEHGYGA